MHIQIVNFTAIMRMLVMFSCKLEDVSNFRSIFKNYIINLLRSLINLKISNFTILDLKITFSFFKI